MAQSVVVRAGGRAAPTAPGPVTPPGASVALRFRTRLSRHHLDGLILRAVARPDDRALALREAQLAGRRERTRAAAVVENALEVRPQRAASAAVPVDFAAVAVARPALDELIAMLRSPSPVEPRGVALALRLVGDAGSPLFRPPGGADTDREALYREARRALFALAPPGVEPQPEPRRG
jgi:hypothetical protein